MDASRFVCVYVCLCVYVCVCMYIMNMLFLALGCFQDHSGVITVVLLMCCYCVANVLLIDIVLLMCC
jgi:hypothetical protein